MADIFPLAHIEQFNSSVQHLAAIQKYAFEGKGIRLERNIGEVQWFNQIGERELKEITSRNADVTYSESEFGERAIRCAPFGDAAIYDKFDEARAAIDPVGTVAQDFAFAVNKAKNAIIVRAALGTAMHRTTKASFGDPVELPDTRKLPVDLEQAGTNTNLTLAKLIAIKSLLSQDDVADASQKYFVYSQGMLDALLRNVTEVKSTDYAQVKALVDGTVPYFLGMHFIKCKQLPIVNGVRTAFGYVANAIAFGIQKDGDVKTKVYEVPGKWNSVGIKTTVDIGATRMREDWVATVDCDEAA